MPHALPSMVFAACIAIGACLWAASVLLCMGALIQDNNLRTRQFGPLFRALPSVSELGSWAWKVMIVGHIALGLALLCRQFTIWSAESVLALFWTGWVVAMVVEVGVLGWRARRGTVWIVAGFCALSALLAGLSAA